MSSAIATVDNSALESEVRRLSAVGGRASHYSDDIAARFIIELESGKSLTQIERLPGMPALTTLYRWRDRHPVFAKAWKCARERQGETAAALMTESAVNMLNAPDDMSMQAIKAAGVSHRALQWIAERHCPDVYQETKRVQVDHTHGVADRLARARTIDVEAVRVDED